MKKKVFYKFSGDNSTKRRRACRIEMMKEDENGTLWDRTGQLALSPSYKFLLFDVIYYIYLHLFGDLTFFLLSFLFRM